MASNRKFGVPINLLSLSSDPASADEGDVYYNTTDDRVRVYKNSTWVNLAYADDVGITSTDYITFDTTPEATIPTTQGTLSWDAGESGLNLTANTNVDIHLGQQNIVLVKNATGSSISKGSVVYINGAAGQRPTVALADAATEATSSKTLGLTAQTIADGAEGFVTTFGVQRGINTNGMTEGAAVWLASTTSSTAGTYTTTIPAEPAHSVFIGYVVKASATAGEIFVNPQNGYELNELHGVSIDGTPADNEVLAYDTTSGWINQTASEAGLEPTISAGTTSQYWRGDKSWQTLNKSAVGLSNVENTALSTWAGSTNITTVGAITATSVNKLTITAPATGSTLAIADGKTLTASNTLTFTGTDSSSVAFGTGGTVAYTNVATLSSLSSIGTITTGVWNGTAITSQYGGTGQSGLNPFTQWGITYAASTTALAQTAAGTSGYLLKSNAISAPTWVDPGTLTVSSATTATNATNTAITDDTTTNATMYLTWVTANTGSLPQKVTSTTNPLTFNPSTGNLVSTKFNGLTLTTTTGTFTLTNAKTFAVQNTLTLAGTDLTTMTFPSTSSTVMTLAQPGTLTGTLTLRAGTAAVNTAPLYFTSGTNLTTAATGAMEFDGTNLYFTPSTTRRTFAFLDSPTFTGTPAAPTAAADTNTTQIATTAYVIGQGYLKSSTASSTYAPLSGATFTGDVVVGGTLTVNGTTTTLNVNSILVDDKNIEMGSVGQILGITATLSTGTAVVIVTSSGGTSGMIPGQTLTKTAGTGAFGASATILSVDSSTQFTASVNHSVAGAITFTVGAATDVTADGGGITLKGTTDKTFNWVDATDAWTSSEHINLASGKAYYINGTSVLNATTLGSGITSSSLTSFGSNPTLSGTITLSNTPIIKTANSASTTSNISITTGDTSGALTDSGSITIDTGSIVGGTAGTVSIGNTRASAITIGNGLSSTNIVGAWKLGGTEVTTTATKLNYLTSATGTTGTASTNIVFSTSPTITTSLVTDTTGTFTLLNTNATTLTAFGSATTLNLSVAGTVTSLNIGTNNTNTLSVSIGSGATSSGNTKTVNIGNAAGAGSTTAINLGTSGTAGSMSRVQWRGELFRQNTSTTTANAWAVGSGGGGAFSIGAHTQIDDTGSTTTVAHRPWVFIAQPTFDSTASLTLTNASTLYIANAPTAGSANTTITNAYAMYIAAGASYIGGTLNVASTLTTTSPSFTTSVTTGSTTMSVFNTTATTVNAFGAATSLTLGATTGNTTVRNTLLVTKVSTADASSANTSTLTIKSGDTENTGFVTGDVSIDTGAGILGATNGSITIGGTNALAVTIGRSGKTTTINGTLTLANALAYGSGGTGQTTYTKGDILTSNGTGIAKLAVGTTNGQVLTVDSAATNGVKWSGAMFQIPNLTSVMSGGTLRFRSPMSAYSAGTTILNSTGRTYYTPIYLPTFTISKLEIQTGSTFSGSATVRVAIYNDNGSGVPSTVLVDGGALNPTAASTVYQTTTLSTAVTAGLYWIAWNFSTNATTNNFAGSIASSYSTITNNYHGLFAGPSATTPTAQNFYEVVNASSGFATAGTLVGSLSNQTLGVCIVI